MFPRETEPAQYQFETSKNAFNQLQWYLSNFLTIFLPSTRKSKIIGAIDSRIAPPSQHTK